TSMSSYLALPLYREKIRPMKTPELTSVFVNNVTMNVYPNGEKLVFRGLMTDAGYWKIFDFRFVEGGPFDEASVENQANFIILRESAAAEYFGKSDSYLGKEVIWGLKGRFKVTGV